MTEELRTVLGVASLLAMLTVSAVALGFLLGGLWWLFLWGMEPWR